MGVGTNVLAAALTLGAILHYVFVYTALLKRRTPVNIVWGGAAGCAPVLIGWAAVTGGLSVTAGVLFLVVFFWTPPHFWALALHFRRDYAAAGVPMLPVVVDRSHVAGRIVGYSWATVLASLALWPLATSWAYGSAALVLGAVLLAHAYRLRARARRAGPIDPLRLFAWSTTYLAGLSAALILDVLLRAWVG